MLLLLGSLIGSYFNIPIAELPQEQVESDKAIEFFGMQYAVPVVENLPGTVIAVNVGGAVIPTLMSLYLLITRQMWVKGAIATAIVAVVLHWLADPGARGRHCGTGVLAGLDHRRSLMHFCRARTPRRSPIFPAAWAP